MFDSLDANSGGLELIKNSQRARIQTLVGCKNQPAAFFLRGIMMIHRGRTVGRLNQFLRSFIGNRADACEFLSKKVKLLGEVVASYTWSEEFSKKDLPLFTFLEDKIGKHPHNEEVFDSLLESNGVDFDFGHAHSFSEETGRVMHQSLFTELLSPEVPSFYMFKDRIWCTLKSGGNDLYYYFHSEMNCWLRN